MSTANYIAPNVVNKKTYSIPDGVLGMFFVIATELMFFTGLISAYLVNRAGAIWPPIGQPRLPIQITAFNTVILLCSAITIYLFRKKYAEGKGRELLVVTILLGLAFVVVQGVEWVKLISFGLTTTSSLFGSFFYAIIGMHGFHVIVGLFILLYLFLSVNKKAPDEKTLNTISACSMYWYFVAGIWPVLYGLVYLS